MGILNMTLNPTTTSAIFCISDETTPPRSIVDKAMFLREKQGAVPEILCC